MVNHIFHPNRWVIWIICDFATDIRNNQDDKLNARDELELESEMLERSFYNLEYEWSTFCLC